MVRFKKKIKIQSLLKVLKNNLNWYQKKTRKLLFIRYIFYSYLHYAEYFDEKKILVNNIINSILFVVKNYIFIFCLLFLFQEINSSRNIL